MHNSYYIGLLTGQYINTATVRFGSSADIVDAFLTLINASHHRTWAKHITGNCIHHLSPSPMQAPFYEHLLLEAGLTTLQLLLKDISLPLGEMTFPTGTTASCQSSRENVLP